MALNNRWGQKTCTIAYGDKICHMVSLLQNSLASIKKSMSDMQ